MKKYFCCILLTVVVIQLFGNFEKDELRERLYAQTDKYLYLAGEPILMKLLTTNAEQIPLVFSKVAYVELIGDSVARLQIKVELSDGIGAGLMLLPVDLPTGFYRLIAYTQFMRNEGIDVFFEKNIAVLNAFQSGYQPGEQKMATEIISLSDKKNTSGAISLQVDKATYTTRDRGELILIGLPENIHTLSVSITGKEILPVTENSASLFRNNITKKTTEFIGKFIPEYEGHIIMGKIIDNQTEKEVIDEQSLISGISFPGDKIRFFSGRKTETGDVSFVASGISGMNEIASVILSEGEKYRVDIQSPFVTQYVPKPMPAFYIDSAYYRQLLARSVALQAFRYFSEDPSENRNVSKPYIKMKPSVSYPLDEYTRFTTMQEVFIEFIEGARFRRNAGKQEISVFAKRGDYYNYGTTMPLVLLDGVPISDHDVIYNYNPLSVEQINVYYGPCVLGGRIFDGIVELITYRRLRQDLSLNKSTQIIPYEGPQLPYQLNTPDYSDDKNRNNRIPDGRHTLLWNPDVRTKGKNSIRLPFNTSDLTGEFQATMEGITNDGEFIFETSFFKVE